MKAAMTAVSAAKNENKCLTPIIDSISVDNLLILLDPFRRTTLLSPVNVKTVIQKLVNVLAINQ